MLKLLLTLLNCSLFSLLVNAQTFSGAFPGKMIPSPKYAIQRRPIQSKHHLSLEFGGVCGFGSLNYERRFRRTLTSFLTLRVGAGGGYFDSSQDAFIGLPVMVHQTWGVTHCIDLGIGQLLSYSLSDGSFDLRTPLSLGYRIEPLWSSLYYRFAYTPLISYLDTFHWQHWGGVTIGYKIPGKRRRKEGKKPEF